MPITPTFDVGPIDKTSGNSNDIDDVDDVVKAIFAIAAFGPSQFGDVHKDRVICLFMQYPRVPAIESLEPRALFAADLSAQVLAVVPPAAIGGEKVKAGAVVTVTNIGDETARGKTPIEIFLSLDHALDDADTLLLTSQAKLKLRATKSKAIKLKFRTFPILPDGEYHLIARINNDGAIPEASASNNIGVDINNHLQLETPKQDLSAAFNFVPGASRLGKSVKILVDVGNIGNLPVKGKVTFAIAASTDTTLDPVGTPLATATAKLKVPINDVATFKLKFKIPSGFTAGTYSLVGIVDSTNVVAETDETNNPFPGFSTITIS
jgi:hypothetical protein